MITDNKILHVLLGALLFVVSHGSAGESSGRQPRMLAKKSKSSKSSKRSKRSKSSKSSKSKKSKKSPKIPFERKELCVVGGGAAGAYTAYEAQKRGYETLLIEPQADLGGNCEILQIPSTIDPSVTYSVNAAVIIFSPTDTVTSFFQEFGATAMPFDYSSLSTFIFGTPFGTIPAPPVDPTAINAALMEYTTIFASPPYLGTFDPTYPVPNFGIMSDEQSELLLEPFGMFLAKYPGITPLVGFMSALLQGYGLITSLPVWEVFTNANPTYVAQILSSGFLMLPDGCQEIYDKLKDRMIAEDPDSLLLNTKVNRIIRRNGRAVLDTDSGERYRCEDAVIAFRPDELDGTTLKDISETEEMFFGDLTYNGYVPSIFKMEPGPALLGVGVDINTQLSFSSGNLVDVGIATIIKDQPEADFPWRVFYQPSEPADTPEKLEAVEEAIVVELTNMGFVNIECLFIKNHKYQVKPSSEQCLKDWVPFFDERNNNDDGLYWTGAVAAGENSEHVWEYSRRLLDAKFPSKA